MMEAIKTNNRFSNLAAQAQAEVAEDKKASKPGFMSFKAALEKAKAGASPDAILGQAVPVRPPAKHTSESERDHAEYEDCPKIPSAFKGKVWTTMNGLVAGRPSEEEMRMYFIGKEGHIPNFTPVMGIVRDPLDPHYKSGGGKENLCTVVHATRLIKQAPDAFTRIVTSSEEEFSPEMVTAIRKVGEEARHFVVTNGPLSSCFQRLVAAAGVRKPRGDIYVDPEVIEEVAAMLPWRPEYVRDLKGAGLDHDWVEVNLASNSGFPWDKPKKDVLIPAYETAMAVLNAIAEGKIRQLMDAHPQWMLVKVMNKLDRYDMRELQSAPVAGVVRQYFVYGFHWVLLYSTVNQNISQAMVGFWDDPKSFSAHGFSWQNGGPQRLVDWVRWAAKQGPGLYGIAYSDDQLWVVVCKDGAVYILTPDIKRMDLNLVNSVGRLYNAYGRKVLAGKADKTWLAVLELLCRNAFRCPVIMEYAMVMLTENFLHSGVPGTPEFDQVASAAYFGRLKRLVGQPANREDALEKLKSGMAQLEAKMGLSMKPWKLFDTSGPHAVILDDAKYVPPEPTTPAMARWNKSGNAAPKQPKWLANDKAAAAMYVTPWVFLGKNLVYDPRVQGWLPGSDPVRALASILSPKARQEGTSGIRGQMQRVRQIIAGGGFTMLQMYHGAKSWYNTMRELGNTPADPYEPQDQEIVDKAVDLEMTLRFEGPNFPSYFECANIYLPLGRKVELSTLVPQAGGVGVKFGQKLGTDVMSTAALAAQLFGEDEEEDLKPGQKWSELPKGAPVRSAEDAGASNITQMQAVPASQMGRAAPMTEEERQEKLRKAKIRHEERMAKIYRATVAARGGMYAAKAGHKGRQLLGAKQVAAIKVMAEQLDAEAEDYRDEDHKFEVRPEEVPDDEELDRWAENQDLEEAFEYELERAATHRAYARYKRDHPDEDDDQTY